MVGTVAALDSFAFQIGLFESSFCGSECRGEFAEEWGVVEVVGDRADDSGEAGGVEAGGAVACVGDFVTLRGGGVVVASGLAV